MNDDVFFNILKKRGISPRIAEIFEIGLLYNNKIIGFFDYPIPHKFLNKTGLIFPIKDLYSNIVSYYLKFPKNIKPKYDSTPFDKNILFGLDKSKDFIYNFGYAILVEGPFDVMTLMSYEIYNVCALLGTSANYIQLSLLKRFTNKCYILFDSDSIGRTKALQLKQELLRLNFEVEIIFLPENMDPDTYVIQYGSESLKQKIFSS